MSNLLVLTLSFFFFTATSTTEIYTLSLHDALPIYWHLLDQPLHSGVQNLIRDLNRLYLDHDALWTADGEAAGDRKSTRLNSSHLVISYAVFCLKKKIKQKEARNRERMTNSMHDESI